MKNENMKLTESFANLIDHFNKCDPERKPELMGCLISSALATIKTLEEQLEMANALIKIL
jgi:hypothetical protein